ncbi:hypothetical protein [Bacillus cereus]|uniref:hypothetical protein n=1 Tax=Bacillus cereus TaxID=1396 RepID=UPI003D024531
MCICGSDRRPGFRQCCGSLSLQKKEESIKELQKLYMKDTVVNNPKYEELMLMTLHDVIPHLSHQGLNILTSRLELLQRMKGVAK